MAKSAQIATVNVNVYAQNISSEGAACDWFSGLLSENEKVIDWAYVKLGGQWLSPKRNDKLFNATIQLLLSDEVNAQKEIRNLFTHPDVQYWQYAKFCGQRLTPQPKIISDNYEEGDFLIS